MKIICKSGIGQPVNPHWPDFTGYHQFANDHPPLPCYLNNGSVAPNGEYEVVKAWEWKYPKDTKYTIILDEDDIPSWCPFHAIYLCQADTEADVKKEKGQNSPDDFKKLAIEKLTALKYDDSSDYVAYGRNTGLDAAIEVIKAL